MITAQCARSQLHLSRCYRPGGYKATTLRGSAWNALQLRSAPQTTNRDDHRRACERGWALRFQEHAITRSSLGLLVTHLHCRLPRKARRP